MAELRRVLGAATVVARSGDTVVAVGDDGQVEVPDDYPAAFPYHIVTDGAIIDYAGRPVCTGLELLGDFHIIDEIETVDDSLVVTVEDRRALAGEGENGEVDIPRWAYDCERQATVMLPSTSSFELTVETTVQRITTSTGLVLVAEWGHGDTPLRLTTGDGTVVIDESQTAFDYVQSADAQTIYFTSYSGTGAASPPDAVVAVDVATGTERWRLDVAGFVWILDNQLVIEAVDTTTLTDLGDFPGQEVVVVDPATGAKLDRFPFDGRLIGLF